MSKLPDYTALGETRKPEINTSVPSILGTGASAYDALSQGVESVKKVFKEIDDQNENLDTLRAQDALNQLKLSEVEMRAGEDGYLNKKGKDAVAQDVSKAYGSKFRDQQRVLAQGLANDRQRDKYTRAAEVEWIKHQNNILTHVANEKGKYATEVFENTKKIEVDDAVTNYKNPTAINTAILRSMAAIDTEARDKKWPEEKTRSEKELQTSTIHRGVIDRFLANEEAGSATSYYKAVKSQVKNDKDIIHIEARLKEGNTLASAYAAIDSINDKYGVDSVAARNALRSLPAKVREKAERGVENNLIRNTEQQSAVEAQQLLDQSFGNPAEATEKAKKIHANNPVYLGHLNSKMAEINKLTEANETRDENNAVKSFSEKVDAYKKNGQSFNALINSIPPKALAGVPPEVVRRAKDKIEGKEPTEKEQQEGQELFNEYMLYPRKIGALTEKQNDEIKSKLTNPKHSATWEIKRKESLKLLKANEYVPKQNDLTKAIVNALQKAGAVEYLGEDAKRQVPENKIITEAYEEAYDKIKEKEAKENRPLKPHERQEIINESIRPFVKVKLDMPYWFDKEVTATEASKQAVFKAYVNYEKIPEHDIINIRKFAESNGIKAKVSDETVGYAYGFILQTEPTLKKPGGPTVSDRNKRLLSLIKGMTGQ